MRGNETDPYARRVAVLESAFDKSREQVWRERREEEKERGLQVGKTVEVEVDADGERQWLGAADDFDFDLSQRERSDALDVVVERKLEKRTYGPSDGECQTFDVFELPRLSDLLVDPEPDTDLGDQNLTHEPRQQSWWRSTYERVSQHHPGRDESPASSSPPKRRSRSRHTSKDAEQRVRLYDDQPPRSLLKTYRDNSKPGHELPPGAQSPRPPGIRTSQDLAGLPMQDRYPFLPATPVSVTRTDTVLNRLFPNPSVRSKGNSMYSGGTSMVLTSRESHRTHLPINAAPSVLAQSVDAGRAVEISPSTLGPTSPVRDTRELHAMLSYLPVPPPLVQSTRSGLDQGDTDLPPSPPPKSSPRPSHRRESAHYQATLADDLFGAPATIRIPTTTSPTSTEDHSRHTRSHQHGPPDCLTPRYPRTSRTYETPHSMLESDASPSRSWSTPGPAAPAHIFAPQPGLSRSRKRPQSKSARRTSVPVPRDGEPSPPLTPFSSDYHLYHLPDSRSPPSEPFATLIPSRHQHS